MAVLAAQARHKIVGPVGPKVELQAVGADTFYMGGMCYIDAAGKAQLAYVSTDVFAGIIASTVVVTAADQAVEVYPLVVMVVYNANIIVADEGMGAYVDLGAVTDNPADLISDGSSTAAAANDPCVGKIFRVGADNWVTIGFGYPLLLAHA